ncbi:hypothetical protein GUJ93_ZPchr0005g14555 [Zizania palustris]|uniref:Peptidase A1 domain-containing protein n=1 Tax=Zizania palustris TaxID=103762 RepID=A0A8J5W1M3_ZIZPA|nr:hypothetical protein GUJ93_ZPchr0005g14555 [Zizania palustris]
MGSFRNRHARVLAATDIPLGGLGLITYSGLYYAEIRIGTPPQRYFVQVDTGSAIFWINCVYCYQCPRESDLGFNLTLYDPKESSTADWVQCKNEFCHGLYGNVLPDCTIGNPCPYKITYGDDGSTLGMFVSDLVQYDQVTGNGQTQPANTSIVFGCGYQQGGSLNTSNGAIDGIIGFAKPNTTMLSQLAATGKAKKIFSHCLDTTKGGGIFAIGDVVEPRVKTTPLPDNNKYHYSVNLMSIVVGGTVLELPADIFEISETKGTIIDSGTTMAYLPTIVYNEIIPVIFAKHQDIKLRDYDDYFGQCFQFNDSVDFVFPNVTFHFKDDLALNVYPYDYLLEIEVSYHFIVFL